MHSKHCNPTIAIDGPRKGKRDGAKILRRARPNLSNAGGINSIAVSLNQSTAYHLQPLSAGKSRVRLGASWPERRLYDNARPN